MKETDINEPRHMRAELRTHKDDSEVGVPGAVEW